MTRKLERVVLAMGLAACGGCSFHIDKPTEVPAGGRQGSVYAVDGDVHVGPRARIGAVRVVEGKVVLDEWARASAIGSVSGAVVLGRQATCQGNLSNVDGSVRLEPGARVDGDVLTYVSDLSARDAQIAGAIHTVSGRVTLSGITHVGKGIRLDEPDHRSDDDTRRLPVVTIGPGVVVDGPIVAARGGTLRVSRQARIGPVEGLVPQWFDGEPPPALAAGTAH